MQRYWERDIKLEIEKGKTWIRSRKAKTTNEHNWTVSQVGLFILSCSKDVMKT